MLLFFSWKKYLWFKSEERAVKRGVSPPLPVNYFFKKIGLKIILTHWNF